jgi:transcriptional regulator with XRE-family HTH domain
MKDDFSSKLHDELVKAWKGSGKTQHVVARNMLTTQGTLSRMLIDIKTGSRSPTVNTLRRFARACEMKLEIRLTPLYEKKEGEWIS